MQTLVVLTGASRGIGEGIGLALCQPNIELLALSRHESAALVGHAQAQGAGYLAVAIDLTDPLASVAAMLSALTRLGSKKYDRVCLINNAGTLDPMGHFDAASPQALDQAMRLNLTSPMALSAAFLRFWRQHPQAPADLRILNISSGAGRRAIPGWVPYCAGKAGLDHFSNTLAIEEHRLAAPHRPAARVVSLAPGVVDTAMQSSIREQTVEHFPDVANYQSLKTQGQLANPRQVGEKIAAFLLSDVFGQTVISDLRTL